MIPTGSLTGRPGSFLAATTSFEIRVTGKGGHAAMPHLAIDPVLTAAKIISSTQSLISREQNAMEPAVISFTAVNCPPSYNIIPSQVTIMGTIRSLTSKNKDHLKERLAETASSIAQADRCKSEFATIGEDYPETFNDPGLWEKMCSIGKQLLGEENISICEPILGGEDFAYYGAHAPACFVALGCGNDAEGCNHSPHHPSFKVDEASLHIGTALHLAFVAEHLRVSMG